MKQKIKINDIEYVSFNITKDDVIYIPKKLEKKMEYFGCLDLMEKARITQLTFTIKENSDSSLVYQQRVNN